MLIGVGSLVWALVVYFDVMKQKTSRGSVLEAAATLAANAPVAIANAAAATDAATQAANLAASIKSMAAPNTVFLAGGARVSADANGVYFVDTGGQTTATLPSTGGLVVGIPQGSGSPIGAASAYYLQVTAPETAPWLVFPDGASLSMTNGQVVYNS